MLPARKVALLRLRLVEFLRPPTLEINGVEEHREIGWADPVNDLGNLAVRFFGCPVVDPSCRTRVRKI